MASERITLTVAGPEGEREVGLSSPNRVLWPELGITKHELAEYVIAVSGPFLEANGNRPVSLERFPDGVVGDSFFSKNPPKGAPAYVEAVTVTYNSGRRHPQLVLTEPAAIAWAVQMNTIVFHPWASLAGDTDNPVELRIDLDPQPGTTFADAVRVAGVARALCEDLGMRGFVKTSGNRGIHVYVRIAPQWEFVDVRHAAIAFGRELEKRDDQVTTAWWKEERGERIFVDFNQNTRDRTIASAYSLRARPGATVSTPLTWTDLAELADPAELNLFTVPARLTDGDPWAEIDDVHHSLEPLLQLWEEHPVELNYPPDHPKMPGEPPRVQPSKKVAAHWDEHGNRVEE
jgi:DNA ligase D